jgi:hypothetical protein
LQVKSIGPASKSRIRKAS